MGKKFWKVYKIVVSIFLVLIIITLSTLYLFLASYEKSIPTHQVDDVITWINDEDKNKIIEKLEVNNKEINSKEVLVESLNLEKGNYFYIKNAKESKKDTPVYTLYKDSNEIATIYLKRKKEKNLFNSPRYEVDKINGLLKDDKNITIIAPANAKVYINNNLITESYLVENNYQMEKINYMSPYVTMDIMNKYVVENLYNPKVKVKYNEKEKELENSNDIYIYKYDSNEDLLNSLKSYIEDFTKKYTRYVVKENPFGSITPYIISSSNAYSFLKKIAMTNLWSGDHTPTEFSEFTYSNMQYYNDSSFSVEVSYTYGFTVTGGIKRDFDTKITLYMVKQNNKWYVVGLNT